MSSSPRVGAVATVALVGIAYFATAIVALHILRSDQNALARPTSDYAVGSYGAIMKSAFASMSIASLALVVGLRRGVAVLAQSRVGLVLLGLWALGALVAMIFPIDLEGAPQTISGTIHRINGPLAFSALTAGVVLVSWRLKHDDRWRPLSRTLVALSLVMLAAYIATPVAFAAGFGGLVQRISLAAFVTWVLLTAGRLRSATASY